MFIPALFLAVLAAFATADLPAQTQKVGRLETGCSAGRGADCHELARIHRDGKERLAKDAVRAAHFYRKACDSDQPAACQEYGEILLQGAYGLALDTTTAIEVLSRACLDDPEGKSGKTAGLIGGRRRCAAIVDLFRVMPARDRSDSVEWKQIAMRACNRGKTDGACVLVGGPWRAWPDSIPLDDSTKKRLADEEASRLFELARADSIRRADSIAAARPKTPEPGKGDSARSRGPSRESVARRLTLKRSCDAGEPQDCVAYAVMLERAEGGARNRPGAAAARAKACQLDKTIAGCSPEKR